jgi:hypothetical protein
LEVNEVLGEERDENEAYNSDQRYDHRLSISVPLAHNTVDEETEDFPHICTIGKTCLPRSRDLIWILGVTCWATVPCIEGWEGIEIGQKDNVVPFHDDSRREDHTEHHSFGVCLERLSDGHALFVIGGILGLIHEVWHFGVDHRHLAEHSLRGLQCVDPSIGVTVSGRHDECCVPEVLEAGGFPED